DVGLEVDRSPGFFTRSVMECVLRLIEIPVSIPRSRRLGRTCDLLRCYFQIPLYLSKEW
ncbi:hypothetical protein SK128_019917, partial [Halocaridina rubra]